MDAGRGFPLQDLGDHHFALGLLSTSLFSPSHLSGFFETGTAPAMVKAPILLSLRQSVESWDGTYATTLVVLSFLCHSGPFLSFYKIPFFLCIWNLLMLRWGG